MGCKRSRGINAGPPQPPPPPPQPPPSSSESESESEEAETESDYQVGYYPQSTENCPWCHHKWWYCMGCLGDRMFWQWGEPDWYITSPCWCMRVQWVCVECGPDVSFDWAPW